MSDADSAIVRVGPRSPAPTAPARVATTVATGGTPTAPPSREYRVQGGETLTAIARKFQCDTKQLARGQRDQGAALRIRPGQRLKLEGCRRTERRVVRSARKRAIDRIRQREAGSRAFRPA